MLPQIWVPVADLRRRVRTGMMALKAAARSTRRSARCVHGGAGVDWCYLAAASKGPRNIADKPGRLYLNNVCPKTDAFAVCSYRDRDFKIADDFLWTGSPTT